jgi:hypothetical protein
MKDTERPKERGTNMRTRLFAVLVALAAVAVFTTEASAMYHAGMGVFMQRDPGAGAGGPARMGAGGAPAATGSFIPRDPTGSNQYADGMNLYQYVGGNPVNYSDPTGLWKFNRQQEWAWTHPVAEEGDTIATLAKEIGLDVREWKAWMDIDPGLVGGGRADFRTSIKTAEGKKGMDGLRPDLKICPGERVMVPNTVLAYWAGELGGFGKFWVMWSSDVAALKRRGFHVIEAEGWNANKLSKFLASKQKDKLLHGVFMWGHGSPGYIYTTAKAFHDRDRAYYSYYRDWHPQYRMGLGVLFACYTDTARSSFSTDAVFWGKTGTLWPHGFHLFGPSISELLPPEKQGTQE